MVDRTYRFGSGVSIETPRIIDDDRTYWFGSAEAIASAHNWGRRLTEPDQAYRLASAESGDSARLVMERDS